MKGKFNLLPRCLFLLLLFSSFTPYAFCELNNKEELSPQVLAESLNRFCGGDEKESQSLQDRLKEHWELAQMAFVIYVILPPMVLHSAIKRYVKGIWNEEKLVRYSECKTLTPSQKAHLAALVSRNVSRDTAKLLVENKIAVSAVISPIAALLLWKKIKGRGDQA